MYNERRTGRFKNVNLTLQGGTEGGVTGLVLLSVIILSFIFTFWVVHTF